jgi:hypothetical protein
MGQRIQIIMFLPGLAALFLRECESMILPGIYRRLPIWGLAMPEQMVRDAAQGPPMTSQEDDIPDRRATRRKQVALWANATWIDGGPAVRCAIRDATDKSCRIVTSHIEDLPDDITLRVDGLAKPIKGRIVWRSENAAGIEFA